MSVFSSRGPSLYEILEVGPTATQEDIRRNFRRLAFKHHPDKNPGDAEATQRYQKISKAYNILTDSKKRQLYDEYGDLGLQIGKRLGEEKAQETCKKLKTNPCCMCLCGLLSLLTCCYCCLCCCFCCCCCGQLECADDDTESIDIDLTKLDDDVVTSQPTEKTSI